MTGPHLKKEYSAADIERYHNGGMTPEEAHALERAALDDPFLSDAVDGYVHTPTPEADIAFLKSGLKSRTAKVVVISKKAPAIWWRAAAMIALLAGLGWMVYKLSGKDETDLADRTETTQSNEPESSKTSAADSANVVLTEIPSATIISDQKEEKAIIKNKVPKRMKTFETADAVTSTIAADSAVVLHTQAAAPPALEGRVLGMEMAKRAPTVTFRARVVDANNNAVPFATVKNTKYNTATQTDVAGTFSIAAPDSTLTVAVDAVGFESRQIRLNTQDTSAAIVLQHAEASLNEVVVTGYGTKARRNDKVRLEAVQPVGGWKRLNDYVSKNALSTDEEEAGEDSEVIVSFDVDKRGNAIDIMVEKSLCPTCDAAAVRIVQEGSKWKKDQTATRAKAHIRF